MAFKRGFEWEVCWFLVVFWLVVEFGFSYTTTTNWYRGGLNFVFKGSYKPLTDAKACYKQTKLLNCECFLHSVLFFFQRLDVEVTRSPTTNNATHYGSLFVFLTRFWMRSEAKTTATCCLLQDAWRLCTFYLLNAEILLI